MPNIAITTTEDWRRSYPGARMGVLAMQRVANPDHDRELEQRKAALELDLRARYAGLSREDLLARPVLQAYRSYYKRFKKTYHVLLQLESVIFKGKPIISASTLVEAMFMAELDTLLLTAIHDLDRIERPITVDIASGEEAYTLLRGEPQTCQENDMIMRDGQGVICSLIYGSDQRTRVSGDTQNVLFAIYVPPGVAENEVENHLKVLERNIRLISPESTCMFKEIVHAAG